MIRTHFKVAAAAMFALGAAPAFAQSKDATPDTNAATTPADSQDPQATLAQSQDSKPPSTLTGEWGGLRTNLRDDGVDLTGGYTSESAWNASGGTRERVRETGQFTFGATVDTEKLLGLKGGTFQATVTYRRGQDLGADAGLGVLQQVQEVYGRGQTWRLTQFWYQQEMAGGHVDLKLGRLTQGEDFAAFSCQFENLSFCGAPPGNLVGDYWYNWPISQWAARLRVKNDKGYVMAGVYEANPRNLDNVFLFGRFHGATGVLMPFEAGLTPRLGRNRLPGSYKIGGWYDTSNADDIRLDINSAPQAVTGLSPLRHNGRYGFYAQFQQQLTGTAEDSAKGPQTTQGLTAFLNITQADRATSTTDNQVAAGIFYTGLFRARPKDDFEFAVARTNVNGRAAEALTSAAGQQPNAEYAAEIDYGIHATDWLILRPNVQYVLDPGGYSKADDVVIVGMKGAVTF